MSRPSHEKGSAMCYRGYIVDLDMDSTSFDITCTNKEWKKNQHYPLCHPCLPSCHRGKGCQNGGTCVGASACECRPGFTGKECETLLQEACEERPVWPNAYLRERLVKGCLWTYLYFCVYLCLSVYALLCLCLCACLYVLVLLCLSVLVLLCLFVFVYVFVCICVSVLVCVCLHLRFCACLCVYLCWCLFCACVYVCACSCVCKCMCICICVFVILWILVMLCHDWPKRLKRGLIKSVLFFPLFLSFS